MLPYIFIWQENWGRMSCHYYLPATLCWLWMLAAMAAWFDISISREYPKCWSEMEAWLRKLRILNGFIHKYLFIDWVGGNVLLIFSRLGHGRGKWWPVGMRPGVATFQSRIETGAVFINLSANLKKELCWRNPQLHFPIFFSNFLVFPDWETVD